MSKFMWRKQEDNMKECPQLKSFAEFGIKEENLCKTSLFEELDKLDKNFKKAEKLMVDKIIKDPSDNSDIERKTLKHVYDQTRAGIISVKREMKNFFDCDMRSYFQEEPPVTQPLPKRGLQEVDINTFNQSKRNIYKLIFSLIF